MVVGLSGVIRVITKSDDYVAGVRFVYHEYDYRSNWTTRSLVTNLSQVKTAICEKRRIAKF